MHIFNSRADFDAQMKSVKKWSVPVRHSTAFLNAARCGVLYRRLAGVLVG